MPSIARISRLILPLGLPLALMACSTTTGDLAGRPQPGPVDIVNHPGAAPSRSLKVAANASPPRSAPMDPPGYNFNAAQDLRIEPISNPTPIRRTNLVGLYGEIAGSDVGASAPFDGERNLRQVSYADEGSCFDPDVDRSGQWLAFASTRHRATSDIYLKSTTGRTITQITADPADDLMPAFDPAGDRLAFASNRAGDWNIYITTIDGSPAIQLTNSPDDELHPTWSPDGRQLAYCRLGARSARWEIWCVDVDNPAVHRFLEYGLFPQWSPDVTRNKILFQRSRQRGSRFHAIWTIDVINGESMYPTEIVSAANAAVINPTWSPDARRIAFVTVVDPDLSDAFNPGEADLWVVDLDGTRRTMLTSGQFANFQPVWSPDGSVFFVSDRSGVENIWAISTRGLSSPARSDIASVNAARVGPPQRP